MDTHEIPVATREQIAAGYVPRPEYIVPVDPQAANECDSCQ